MDMLRERPFHPFRIHLFHGTVYEIRHSELVQVGRSRVMIFFPVADELPALFERYVSVSLLHITRLEPMAPPTQAASA